MLTPLERAIATVSPRWAVRRAYFRTALEASGRAYDAAKTGRRTDLWVTAGNGANAEIGAGASLIRTRARDLVRNNPFASIAVRKLAAKTVGMGIMPRLKLDDPSDPRRKSARGVWDAFVDNCDPEERHDFYGLSNILARTVFESGEALLRFIPRPSSARMIVPLQVEVLEPDYIDQGKTEALASGGAIIQGVEYDANGRRVAYWMFDEHPGEIATTFTRRSYTSRRVDADLIKHVFETLRPGQARGVSIFAPVTLKLKDVDDFDDAELMRKKIAACFAAFVKKQGGPSASPISASPTTDTQSRRIERLAPGLIQYLQLDEDVTFGEPPTSDGYVEYMRAQLHAVAAGCGITYEMLTGDLSQTNYSSIRAGMLDFWDLVDQWQHLMLIPQLCNPVWRRVGQLAAVKGLRAASDPWTAIWATPRRRWVDPAKEVEAGERAVRAGFLSLYDQIAEQGEDPDEKLAEYAAINERLDALKLTLDSDPRKVGRASAAQPVKVDQNA